MQQDAGNLLQSSTNWYERLAQLLDWNWSRLSQWWARDHWTNCSPSWTILPTLSIKHCRDSRAHSPTDWCEFRCHKELFKKSFLPFTIRLFNSSTLGNRWNSLHIHYYVFFFVQINNEPKWIDANSFITTLFCEYIFILIIFILCIYLFGLSYIFVVYNITWLCAITVAAASRRFPLAGLIKYFDLIWELFCKFDEIWCAVLVLC